MTSLLACLPAGPIRSNKHRRQTVQLVNFFREDELASRGDQWKLIKACRFGFLLVLEIETTGPSLIGRVPGPPWRQLSRAASATVARADAVDAPLLCNSTVLAGALAAGSIPRWCLLGSLD